jgi:transglutaminase-like putative cysteine protease
MIKPLNDVHLMSLLITIGLIALPHIFNLSMPVLGLFGLLLCLRFISIWKKSWLPKPPLLFLLTLGSFGLLYFQHRTILGRDAGTSLFIIALGLKLMELNKPKDITLITYLAFIVAASQFLYLQNIFMAAYIFFVCCMLLGTLILMNSQRPQLRIAIIQSCLIVAQAIPFMIAMFVFFPRLEAPNWMLFSDKHGAKTGLSDTLEPGSISRLGKSDELVFRVKFSGPVPQPRERYWRGPVFSKTDGKRWTQIKNNNPGSVKDAVTNSGPSYRYTLLQEAQRKNWVFALDIATEFPQNTIRNSKFQLLAKHNPNDRTEYKIISSPNYNTGSISEFEHNENIQLPGKPSSRITKLVRQLRGHVGNPELFIENLLNYFSQKDFYYTLHPPLMPEKPIETFLFDSRYGFCSHYATAFVYLMRVANIPARVVTGYQGGELNKVGGFLEIRQANAHAWAEVWLDLQGWVRFDPTAAVAPERIEQDVNVDLQIASGEVNFMLTNNTNLISKWIKQTGLLWNNVDYQWQRWVINYSSTNRANFLSALGIEKITTMLYWIIGLITSFTAILILLLFPKRRKPSDPALLIYSRFCSKIGAKGLFIAKSEGAKDFAKRCTHKLPQLAKKIDAITALYLKIRYGKSTSETDLKLLKTLVTSFKV